MLTLMVLFVLGLVKFSSMALPATPLRRDTKLCISGSDRGQPTPYSQRWARDMRWHGRHAHSRDSREVCVDTGHLRAR
eukprot:COSAG01_NODE_1718_length_9396_cov_26.510165_4_plen_78_part_00